MVTYDQRTPDDQYRNILHRLVAEGIPIPKNRQGVPGKMLWGVQMHFDISNGFPMITERNMAPVSAGQRQPWLQAIGEIIGFINGARTQAELEQFGCYWWHLWVTPEKCADFGLIPGDLGAGSYGPGFAMRLVPQEYHRPNESRYFNQYSALLEQMRDFPDDRTHVIDPWVPYLTLQSKTRQRKVVVAPCHGWQHYRIVGDELLLHMWQRSGDFVLGVPNNTIQYAALGMMLAQVLGLRFTRFVHSISDCHFYEDQMPAIETMLARQPRPFPTLAVKHDVRDLLAFRTSDFSLMDYNPHPGIKSIPAAI